MSESLIDSTLFIRDSSSSSNNDQYDDIFYEKISDTDDIHLIKTNTGSYELHRNRLISTLKELHHYSHVFVSKLKEEQSELLSSTIEATRILYNSRVLKDMVLNDIREIYKDIKNPIPGTVGAFFVGCFNDDNFNGPIGCNPRCAASLFNCDNDGLECSDTILIFENNTFTSLNNKNTQHAYIYIESYNFVSFTMNQIHKLQEANITTVTLIYSDIDGSYKEVTGRIDIDTLITVCNQNTSTSSSTSIIAIILLIIIALIFLGLIFMYEKYTI
jgi:hypothetical protein